MPLSPSPRLPPAWRRHLFRRVRWRDLDPAAVRTLIHQAREEDLAGYGFRALPHVPGDATTAILAPRVVGRALLVSREELVLCGMPLVPLVLRAYGGRVRFEASAREGERLARGTVLGLLHGPARSILEAERVLLNFLQRMSGIATSTSAMVRALEGSSTRLLDTRKTTPGWRALEKYAVATGGGWNHRLGLYDRIMLKDNHLEAGGAARGQRLAEAVYEARATRPDLVVEVEVDSLDQIPPVVDSGATVILFDNFSPARLRRAVRLVEGRCLTEASGGLSRANLARIRHLGLDFVSSGAMVHHSTWVDIGLDWLKPQAGAQ